MSDISKLSCIVCSKPFEGSAIPGESFEGSPHGSTTFTARGNYGSTIFDPMSGGSFLKIHICDECVSTAAQKNQVIMGEPRRVHNPVDYEFWDGKSQYLGELDEQ